MELLPRSMGTRPRVAVEVRPEGVVAARAEEGAGLMTAVSRAELSNGAMVPGLRAGNVADRGAVASAIRRALDGVSARGSDRSRYVTIVVPDGAVRVLLLDFDALPGKATEALAVVRFRLKKMLPFDAEHAVVSYQVMSSGRSGVQVLAVAMPCDVLAEYEGAVIEAGYVPGAVLPSTLAALAGLETGEAGAAPALVVNAGPGAVTTAIVQGGVLLLHRTVDLGLETGSAGGERSDGIAGMQEQQMNAVQRSRPAEQAGAATMGLPTEADEAVQVLNESEPVSVGRDVTQAVSVAAAYFEDTLGSAPAMILAAGTMGSERISSVLGVYGMEGLRVRDLLDGAALGPGASTSTIPRGWLAGVRGALRS